MKKIILRKPTLSTSILLQKFNNDSSNQDENLAKLVFIQSNPANEIRKLSPDEFEEKLWEFIDSVSEKEMVQAIKELEEFYREINDSEFEAETDSSQKKT